MFFFEEEKKTVAASTSLRPFFEKVACPRFLTLFEESKR